MFGVGVGVGGGVIITSTHGHNVASPDGPMAGSNNPGVKKYPGKVKIKRK